MAIINSTLKNLAKSALDEAINLQSKNIVNDAFIKEASDDFRSLIALDDAPENLRERMKFLGRAAVREYQSFDEIPEADRFVELCSRISSEF
jgi:hypothetical protein